MRRVKSFKSKTSKANKKTPQEKIYKQDKKSKAVKKEVDNIVFDSTMEANYYEYLKEEKAAGRVISITLQPVYVLQEPFKKYGRTIRKIEYISDFLVEYADGSSLIIDVKGRATDEFKIKRKLFDFKYPQYTLKLVTWDKRTKRWWDYDELKKAESLYKREKKKNSK
jgi:hypothetical protein